MGRYASRKFLLALATLASSSWLLAHGYMDGANFAFIMSVTVGAYIAGNVAQKRTEVKQ